MICDFRLKSKNNKVWGWANAYVRMYQKTGWLQAGQYLDKFVPRQFYPQIKELAREILAGEKN
jgi:hypothetical protein